MPEAGPVRGRRDTACGRKGLPFAETRPPCGLGHNVGITLSRPASKARANVGSRIRRAMVRDHYPYSSNSLLACSSFRGLISRQPCRSCARAGTGMSMNFLGQQRLAALGAHDDGIEHLPALAMLMPDGTPAFVDHVGITPTQQRHYDRI